MSGYMDSEQPRGYCGNCGAQVRSGTAFCVSCGAPVSRGSEEPGSVNSGPAPSEGLGSLADDLRARLRRAADRLGDTFSGSRAEHLRHLTGRAARWSRNLPGALKLVFVGAAVLVLLILLSPLAVLICALVFGASVIALIVRVAQRGSVKGWVITAVASLAFAFAFVGISDALYSTGYLGDTPGSVTETDPGDGGQAVGRGVDDSSDRAGFSAPTSQAIEGQIPVGSPNYPVPSYQVIDYSASADQATGYTVITFQVSTASLGQADIRGIAEDFAVKMVDYNSAGILVYDASLEPYDPNPSSGRDPIYSSLDGSSLFPNAVINLDYSRGVYRISYTE
jgi:hypothetical protein